METVESAFIQTELDDELVHRCGKLMQIEEYDAAVMSAFKILESRLRTVVNKEDMTGTHLAQHAFNPERGPLARKLATRVSEREGLRDLFIGAFKLYRNPTAHDFVDYTAAEGIAIINLVNLLLSILSRIEIIPAIPNFPPNLEKILGDYESSLEPTNLLRLRSFLGKCMLLGLYPKTSTKASVPFRKPAFTQFDHWPEPKRHYIAAFYVGLRGKMPVIIFPQGFYAVVRSFPLNEVLIRIKNLGAQELGKYRDLAFDLGIFNNQAFFDAIYDIVADISLAFDASFESGKK